MIELHRLQKNDPFSDRIEEKLKDLVVAHNVQRHPDRSSVDRRLPFIRENDTVVEGRDDLDAYLQRLEAELRQQRSITGDACYIDPETGEVC